MSKSMEFWAACVKPGKAVPVTVEEGMTLRLTQVTPARSPLPSAPGRTRIAVRWRRWRTDLCAPAGEGVCPRSDLDGRALSSVLWARPSSRGDQC